MEQANADALNAIDLYRNSNASARMKVKYAGRVKGFARELGIDTRGKTWEQIFELVEALP